MSGMSNPFGRAMTILETVAASGNGLSLNELARRTGLPPSTTYRIATSQIAGGYLEREAQSGSFLPGPRLKRLGQYLISRGSIGAITGPVLHELSERLDEAVFMTRFNGHTVEFVTEVFPPGGMRAYVGPGREFPPHATASGKMLYAMQSDELVDRALAQDLEAFRPNTMIDPHDVRRHLAMVRERGYATSEDELDAGVFSLACPVVIPTLGTLYTVGAVGIRESFLARFSRDEIAAILQDGARRLSSMLDQHLGIPPTRPEPA